MYEPETVSLDLPIDAWVGAAQNNPATYRSRQVTHILLAAIGLTPDLQESMILKGGTLMMLAYASPRGTQDVDFTVAVSPEPFAEDLTEKLNPAMQRAASQLGYVDIVCKIQSLKRLPRPSTFETATGPALQITIGYAKRGTNDEKRLVDKQASNVLRVDLSFKDPVIHTAGAKLERPAVTIRAYALEDVIGEKLRALLQQPIRNRHRRQDIFDIAWLLDHSNLTDEDKKRIHDSLIGKAEARDVECSIDGFDDPEVKRRASADWNTLDLEVANLPDFETLYARVREFYRDLPW